MLNFKTKSHQDQYVTAKLIKFAEMLEKVRYVCLHMWLYRVKILLILL